MKKVVALSTLLFLVALAASPAVAAAPDISVTVDGEEVSDGDTVEVEDTPASVSFNVSSDVGIGAVRREHGTTLDAEGLTGRQTYTDSFNVSVFGQKEVVIEATDTNGDTRTVTMTLARSSETAPGAREDLEALEDRANRLENETSDLEERRQELMERRQELREQLNNVSEQGSGNGGDGNSSGSGDDGSGGGSQGLPGFTAVVALVAVAVAALSLRKRS